VPPSPGDTPIAITARRGDVLLELRVDKVSFVAGEGGPGTVIARNTGTAPALLLGGCGWATIQVLDEQGRFVGPPEWSTWAISCPGVRRELPPGGEERAAVWFQVPRDATGRRYALQAQTGLSAPPSPGGNSAGMPLVTAPLPLTVAAPTPDHVLRSRLEADRAGWRFVATDRAGNVPPAPHWLVVEAGTPAPSHRNWLADAPDGCWAGGWGEMFRGRDDTPIVVRAWLAVPGYVVAAATQTAVPGSGTRLRPLGTPPARCVGSGAPGGEPRPVATP
jgi:hypothetical protein